MSQSNTTTQAPEQTFEEKVEMFKAVAKDPVAREAFAKSRAEVILPLLEQQSTVRAIFEPRRVPAGGSTRFDIPFDDVECTWVLPKVGGFATVQFEGAEIYVETSQLMGGVEWQLDIAEEGRIDVPERATRLFLNKFIKQEEYAGWTLIKTHQASLEAANSSQVIDGFNDSGAQSGTKYFNIYTLNELLTVADSLGTGGRQVTDIYCSPRRFADFRRYISQLGLPDEMKLSIWNSGRISPTIAGIRFHRVWDSNLVDDNTAYAFTQKDGFYYGIMPIRLPLETYDDPIAIREFKQGIFGRSKLGFGVQDDKGLIVLKF